MNDFEGNSYISIKSKEKVKNSLKKEIQKIKYRPYLIFLKKYWILLKIYLNINKLVEHNNNIYLYKMEQSNYDLLSNIKGYPLDKEQLDCVLNEEEAILVIAGAGAGKSLTIIGKVRYLIEAKYLEQKEILCISFTKKSAQKLKDDLYKTYQYNINVCTFHKLALTILKDGGLNFSLNNDDTLIYLVDEFFDHLIYNFPNIMKLVVTYFFNSKNKKYEDISLIKIKQLKNTIICFINLYKANISSKKTLISFLGKVEAKDYPLLVLIIVIYHMYNIEMKANNEIDFNDLIVLATKHIQKFGLKRNYKYIIIDEYQDTSVIRVNLIKEIINKSGSKLMAVGDDFQSIYKFSGCKIETFLNFSTYFSYSKKYFIKNNYRNNQEIVDVAGSFVMKNKKQLKKKITAHKSLIKPIKIIYYENQRETFNILIKFLIKEKKDHILILGRNNKDLFKLVNSYEDLKNYSLHLNYLTVHKAKGLEEENIIIINLENDIMGFPNKLQFNNIIKLIYEEDENIKFEEERRLFYVALTRTKNYAYLLVNKNKPSPFIRELINDYPDKIEILCIK